MLRPYDINNLVVGAVRVLAAPITEAVPTSLADIVGMESPYTAVSEWFDFGAARESGSYSRGMESDGVAIQQESGDIFEEITDTSRTFSFSMAEIAEDNIKIFENSAAIETIAAAVGESAQKAVPFGSIEDLDAYRVAFVGIRKKQSGVVTESDTTTTRGRMVGIVLNRCTLTADESEIEFDKGTLTHAPVDFTSFPEPGEADGEEYGRWLFEDAGAITGA